ncbi:MAG: DUF2852 domain-containing protein [Paracoccaceae bacterium]
MTTATAASWPHRAENWLDSKGKGAWMAAMILGMIFFWPVGLAILFYMIWSKKMFNGSSRGCHAARHRHRHHHGHGFHSSGNSAFDAYKAETLRRLEEEQESFEAFLQRLREAKDKSEFDDFMDERATAARLDADADEDAKEDA